MNQNASSSTRFRRWKRWIPPTAALGLGGTSLAIWFEEIAALAIELLGVAILAVLAGVVYLFNVCLFKSATPNPDDLIK